MKKIILAVAVAAVATMAVVSSASADVARYQTQSMTITAVQPEGAVGQWVNVWTHTYNVTLNPCNNTFSGTGSMTGTQNGPVTGTETITGHLDANNAVSYTASRDFDSVVYSLANAPLNNSTVTLASSTPVFPFDLEFKVSATQPIASSTYRNHGDYVSQAGAKADAAHSCIGNAHQLEGRRPSSCSTGAAQGPPPVVRRRPTSNAPLPGHQRPLTRARVCGGSGACASVNQTRRRTARAESPSSPSPTRARECAGEVRT